MKLSPAEFDRFFQERRLVLTVVGMSNVGKTRWSKRLRSLGFEDIHCDDLIEARLSHRLTALGYSGLADISRWLGQPYDERYSENQREYISIEKQVMEGVIADAQTGKLKNAVIDTTGSVVHTGEDICSALKEHSLVVYIEATKEMADEMFKRYIEKPKPVIFGDAYKPQEGETDAEALKRCYRDLLAVRSALYGRYADITIPATRTRECSDVGQFFSLLRRSL